MRKLILLEFITLDGVIQSPGSLNEDRSDGFDRGGWIANHTDSLISDIIKKEMDLSFDLLLGRRTFEIWSSYWPINSDLWPNIMKARKYVASNTIKAHKWEPVEFLNDDICRRVHELKCSEGNNIHVYGSSELVQYLLSFDLIDEMWLKIYPIIIGKGKRLFKENYGMSKYELIESNTGQSGIISAKYGKIESWSNPTIAST